MLYREEHTSKGHTYTHSYIYLGNKYITEDGLTPKRFNTRRHYKPFGETIETATNNIGYTGHKFDADTGLVYMQQRYMDPASGRFISNDPIGFSNIHNFNRYAYGNNNPYKYIDPDGMAADWVGDRAAARDLAGQAGVDAYNNGLDTAIEIADTASDFIAPVKGLVKQGIKQAGKQAVKRTCCFIAGTQVLTEEGYKNIEQVVLGEKLWAKNVETGEQDWKSVTKIFVEPERDIYEIKLLGTDDFSQKIEATDDHPFYVVAKGWKTTIELTIGDRVETDGYGTMRVDSVTDQKRQDVTYNFTVADFHTYYVTKRNVLVHNCGKTTIDNKREKHIFRNKEGHVTNTPENKKMLEDVANDPKTTLGNDQHGNSWSVQTQKDGTQVWTQSRGNKIMALIKFPCFRVTFCR